jgi:hypothetical protein
MRCDGMGCVDVLWIFKLVGEHQLNLTPSCMLFLLLQVFPSGRGGELLARRKVPQTFEQNIFDAAYEGE